jgi:PAS domain-containing protein
MRCAIRCIRDFKTFIKVHPEFVTRCMKEIRVIDVNQQTLQMFGAQSKAELLNQISRVFRGEMHDSFAEQLQDLWDGKLVQQREGDQLRPVGRYGVHPHAVCRDGGARGRLGLGAVVLGGHHGANRPRPTWNTWASTTC